MNIIISNSSEIPIYEQIANEIRESILLGTIEGGEILPSIRNLAKDLKISVITTKKAYELLLAEEYITSVPGKGFFVNEKSSEYKKEEIIKKIETQFDSIINLSKKYDIDIDELVEILKYNYEVYDE